MNKLIPFILLVCLSSCSKKESSAPPTTTSTPFTINAANANGITINSSSPVYVSLSTIIKISFSDVVQRSSVSGRLLFNEESGAAVSYSITYDSHDSAVVIKPNSSLKAFTKYTVTVSSGLQSTSNTTLTSSTVLVFKTGIDSTDKFPRISDNQLLDLVQQQTFKYFWDFGHPISGLARERNSSGDVVTTGGSGFGIMAIVTGVNRNFITRSQGLARMQTIVGFLKTKAQTFHGAYSHWLNGVTGAVEPFSAKDNGADFVETSYLIQGLLTARQYFNGADAIETALRNDINSIWNGVDWAWFRQNNQNVLYWHWSPNYNWDINMPVKGWNEALITYVLAASSPTHSIPKNVYDNGWANNGSIKNGNTYYGLQLPLGPVNGGPLFFEHYSFLGINPKSLIDAYANYETQTNNHTLINYNYCRVNPKGYYGYSDSCWGLTASDDIHGYLAHEPNDDNGVISPTAALSSFPYTPVESMSALKFFYYKLGDRIWKEYGFVDAFSLNEPWFASSFLAIDQGPIIVMIENYRSGLLWNLFTSCPEVKDGMRKLGFTAPYL